LANKIDQIIEILKNTGKVQENKLLRRIKKNDLMAPVTAMKAIDEAVRTGEIIKEVRFRKKQRIVFFTVHADISENEKDIFDDLEKLLKEYDTRFSFYKDKFPSSSTIDKAKGYDRFSLFLLHFHVTVEALWGNFGKTREWSNLMSEIRSKEASLNKLISSSSDLEHGKIGRYVTERKFLYLEEAIELIDIYFKEIKK